MAKIDPVARAARAIQRQENAAISAYIHKIHPVFAPESQVNDTAIFTSDRAAKIEASIEQAGDRRVYLNLYDCDAGIWASVFADAHGHGDPHGITASYLLANYRASGLSLEAYLLSQTRDYAGAAGLNHLCIASVYVIGGLTRTEADRQYLARAAASGFWRPAKSLDRYSAEQLHRKAAGLRGLEARGVTLSNPTETNRLLRGHGISPEHPTRTLRPSPLLGSLPRGGKSKYRK